MAGFLPPAVFEIKAIADQAIAKFKDVNGELEKMEGKAAKAGGGISGLDKASRVATAGLFAMGAAFAGFAALGIKEANDSEQALNKLGQTMSNLGINTEANRTQIEKLTDSYEKLGFGNEEAANGFNKLLVATGSVSDATNLLALSADFARVKNMSLEEASATLARASAGNAKAFKEMGISLDTTLPKSEAVAKAMEELQGKIGGQAVNATKTFKVQLQILKEEVGSIAEKVGGALMPVLKNMVEFFSKAIDFISRNAKVFAILGGAIVTAVTKAWSTISAVATAVQVGLTTGQWNLNAALNANPIGLVVAGVMLLVGAFVIAWNSSETFRKAIVKMLQVVVNGVGYLVGAIGSLLGAASKIPGIGDKFKGPAEAVNKTANDIRKFGDGLDKLADKKVSIGLNFKAPSIPDMPNAAGGKTTKGGGISPETKKANEGYMKIVKDFQDKIATARAKFAEKMADIDKNYQEEVLKINTEGQEKITKAQTTFNDTMGKLNKQKAEDLAKVDADNLAKIAEITKQGNEKLLSIVKSSIDRLRNAFSQGTSFSVGDIFKGLIDAGKATAEELLATMKARLAGMKSLAQKASALAGAGFSQTFIEQVVSQGPEIGGQLADSILKAGPDAIKELQTIYGDMENTTNTGLDALAQTMNAGGKLATSELNEAYAQAKIDMANFLTQQKTDYAFAQAEISKKFNEQMAEAEKTRDTAIADAQKEMANALAQAQKQMAEAQAQARKDLNESLTAIEKDFQDKLGSINDATNNTKNAILAMVAALNAARALAAQPMPTPTYSTPVYSGGVGSSGGTSAVSNTNVTVNQTTNASPQSTATAVVNAIKFSQSQSLNLYGSPAMNSRPSTVNTTTLAGIAAASKTTSNFSYGSGNPGYQAR
ncbi:hypothetical protein EB001_02165 [bacterium]|nr:hypothetical protein [bacterium]